MHNRSQSNAIQEKSYSFALRIFKAHQFLIRKNEFVLSRQLLRSGTSIGANVEEAIHAQSKAEFIAKMQTSIKEAFEADYWIRLFRDGGLFTKTQSSSLLNDVQELQKLLTAIIKSSKRR